MVVILICLLLTPIWSATSFSLPPNYQRRLSVRPVTVPPGSQTTETATMQMEIIEAETEKPVKIEDTATTFATTSAYQFLEKLLNISNPRDNDVNPKPSWNSTDNIVVYFRLARADLNRFESEWDEMEDGGTISLDKFLGILGPVFYPGPLILSLIPLSHPVLPLMMWAEELYGDRNATMANIHAPNVTQNENTSYNRTKRGTANKRHLRDCNLIKLFRKAGGNKSSLCGAA